MRLTKHVTYHANDSMNGIVKYLAFDAANAPPVFFFARATDLASLAAGVLLEEPQRATQFFAPQRTPPGVSCGAALQHFLGEGGAGDGV
eukprot:gene13745-biopygen8046